jgi:hypothetical protein
LPPWVLYGRDVPALDPPPAVQAAAHTADALRGPSFRGIAVDLNGDAIDDYLLQGAPESCGTGGCPYVVVNGASATFIGHLFGNPIVVRAESTRGFLNLDLYSHGSATTGSFTSYAFDGRTYVERSTERLTGRGVTDLFEALNRLPRWQPINGRPQA